MYWDRNVIVESIVVQNIDGEKQQDVNQPPTKWHLSRRDKEWRLRVVKLGDISSNGNKNELDKCQKCT